MTEWLQLIFLNHQNVLANERISECVVLVASLLCEDASPNSVEVSSQAIESMRLCVLQRALWHCGARYICPLA
jgi:hypothetical protein